MVGDPFDRGSGPAGVFGDVEANVRADLSTLVTAHPFGEALGAVARRLARSLDEDGNDIKAPIAGTARELRQTLTELARLGVDDDGDFETQLGTPTVRNPKES